MYAATSTSRGAFGAYGLILAVLWRKEQGDFGGIMELPDSVDSTGLSLIALLCNEPSSQQVLTARVT
jgi:hypothetical protein